MTSHNDYGLTGFGFWKSAEFLQWLKEMASALGGFEEAHRWREAEEPSFERWKLGHSRGW